MLVNSIKLEAERCSLLCGELLKKWKLQISYIISPPLYRACIHLYQQLKLSGKSHLNIKNLKSDSIYLASAAAAAATKSLQSCLTLCDPIDSSPSVSAISGILQARTLERVAISFSNAWKWKVKVKPLSHVWLLATSWAAAYQALLSMGFSRQEYWSGVPLPSPI